MGKRTRIATTTILLLAAGLLLAVPVAADHGGEDAVCIVSDPINSVISTSGTLTAGNATLAVSACTNTPIKVNRSETINMAVTNTGNETGAAEIALDVNGTRFDSEAVALAPGETSRFNFTIAFNETGAYELNVTGAGSMETVVSDCLSPYSRYDENCNLRIEISELGEAAADYVRGEITIQELGNWASLYVQS